MHDAAVELGRKGGLNGGPARAKALSPDQRSRISANAAKARWDKRKIMPDSALEWLVKAKGAVELIEYHDDVCPDYPLREWFGDVIAVYERGRS